MKKRLQIIVIFIAICCNSGRCGPLSNSTNLSTENSGFKHNSSGHAVEVLRGENSHRTQNQKDNPRPMIRTSNQTAEHGAEMVENGKSAANKVHDSNINTLKQNPIPKSYLHILNHITRFNFSKNEDSTSIGENQVPGPKMKSSNQSFNDKILPQQYKNLVKSSIIDYVIPSNTQFTINEFSEKDKNMSNFSDNRFSDDHSLAQTFPTEPESLPNVVKKSKWEKMGTWGKRNIFTIPGKNVRSWNSMEDNWGKRNVISSIDVKNKRKFQDSIWNNQNTRSFNRIGHDLYSSGVGSVKKFNSAGKKSKWGSLGGTWGKKKRTSSSKHQTSQLNFLQNTLFFTMSPLIETKKTKWNSLGATWGKRSQIDKVAACENPSEFDKTSLNKRDTIELHEKGSIVEPWKQILPDKMYRLSKPHQQVNSRFKTRSSVEPNSSNLADRIANDNYNTSGSNRLKDIRDLMLNESEEIEGMRKTRAKRRDSYSLLHLKGPSGNIFEEGPSISRRSKWNSLGGTWGKRINLVNPTSSTCNGSSLMQILPEVSNKDQHFSGEFSLEYEKQPTGFFHSVGISTRGSKDKSNFISKKNNQKLWNELEGNRKKRYESRWNGLEENWGKRNKKQWDGLEGNWGKRNAKQWNGLRGNWGKREEKKLDDLEANLDKRNEKKWDGLEGNWDKCNAKQWNGLEGNWGKRNEKKWDGLEENWGKRNAKQWSGLEGNWGKRNEKKWDGLEENWGKRNAKQWNGLEGNWGKRNEKKWDGLEGNWGKRNAKQWNGLEGNWGKRNEKKWDELEGNWGKRNAKQWNGLEGNWGKRNEKKWDGLEGNWGKRNSKQWIGLEGNWGKRNEKQWNGLEGNWGKRNEKKLEGLEGNWGKRNAKQWNGLEGNWGKRNEKKWDELGGNWGKRNAKQWNGLEGNWGIRDVKKWDGLEGNWGKKRKAKQWIGLEGNWGKRNVKQWNELEGNWGKRNEKQRKGSERNWGIRNSTVERPENFFTPFERLNIELVKTNLHNLKKMWNKVECLTSTCLSANTENMNYAVSGAVTSSNSNSRYSPRLTRLSKRKDWKSFRGKWDKKYNWDNFNGSWGKRSSSVALVS